MKYEATVQARFQVSLGQPKIKNIAYPAYRGDTIVHPFTQRVA